MPGRGGTLRVLFLVQYRYWFIELSVISNHLISCHDVWICDVQYGRSFTGSWSVGAWNGCISWTLSSTFRWTRRWCRRWNDRSLPGPSGDWCLSYTHMWLKMESKEWMSGSCDTDLHGFKVQQRKMQELSWMLIFHHVSQLFRHYLFRSVPSTLYECIFRDN